MSETIHSFILSLLASEIHIRDWCESVAGSNKQKGTMALTSRIWLEHNRDRHLSRIKLTYEISPRIVSENTAFRLIENCIQRGYLEECSCHHEAGAAGIKPTRKFLKKFEDFASRMIRDHDQFGFLFKPERAISEDFVIWTKRNGEIIDAVGTEKWLGFNPKELIGNNLEAIYCRDWIAERGGKTAFQKRLKTTFDNMATDGRHVVLTPTLINQTNNKLVQTKATLNLTRRSQHNRGKSSEPVRRGAYEVLNISD